jgi:serine/threonine-protein kinase
MQLGCWTLDRRLAGGGSSQVWLADDVTRQGMAIKVLTKTHSTAIARFNDEIRVLRANQDVPGVMRLLDSANLNDSKVSQFWYVMPRGRTLDEALATASPLAIAEAAASIASTLAALHARGTSHRDVKPRNLFKVDDAYFVGDFGLVRYPGKADVTRARETLGPRWTLAPEMRRDGPSADALKADVYSLAKSLWILLTKEQQGFDGQYSGEGSLAIARYHPSLHLTSLNRLLSEATDNTPAARPDMSVFAERLNEWRTVAGNYRLHNSVDWRMVLQDLFPTAIPMRAVWTDLNQIRAVLGVVGRVTNLNHLFFPRSGGLDLEGTTASVESGCLELITDGLANIVKPARLEFESFSHDPQWDYFRLYAHPLEPSGVYPETLREIGRVNGLRRRPVRASVGVGR